MTKREFLLRETVQESDRKAVRDVLASTGFFYDYEIEVGVELVAERLAGGENSGYLFIFAETEEKKVSGFTCFGPIPCTAFSYDLFWIAVHHECRGMGVGKKLLVATEEAVRKMGGKRVYVETSSRALYEPTRRFYEKHNYLLEAQLKDFYGLNDSKCIYVKEL